MNAGSSFGLRGVIMRRSHLVLVVSSLFASACSVGTGAGDLDSAVISADAGPFGRSDSGDVPPDMVDAGPLPEGCLPEDCENGYDDDCDGRVNNGCACVPREVRSCYAGRPESEGHGACTAGTMVCSDGLEFGEWGDCEGDVVPGEETCDVDENDEDCDGALNEGCECTGSEPIPCGSDDGECTQGTQECVDGLRGDCIGATEPMVEDCNGLDDDCDGMADEDLVRECGSDVGECGLGSQSCVNGAWEVCSGSQEPAEESCDGLDNDCDGMADEDLIRPCGSTLGACRAGMQSCNAGTWSMCEGEIVPTLEDCNSIDDDCNGLTDDGLTRACGTDLGTCSLGEERCDAGAWSMCVGAIGPGRETCDGVLDEDCDGEVDDGCGCTGGDTRSCGTDAGACTAGTETCSLEGIWGTCTGATTGTAETCNNIDDDCDGAVDESITRSCGTDTGTCSTGTETCSRGSWGACSGSVGPRAETCDGRNDEDCNGIIDDGCACVDGQTRSCGTDTGACVAGTERCDLTGTWGACLGQTGPSTETCNNVDDDCDGMVDELLTRGCGTDVGVCQAGTQTCSMGSWGSTCPGSIGSSAEVCDGVLDEDCDGVVDDGCNCTNGATRPCGTGTGACEPGTETCSNGQWGSCAGAIGPTTEICDNADNDCDGGTDENLSRSCGTNVGVCRVGSETCSAGSWGTCTGGIRPGTEVCEGRYDEDCDGTVDDGCTCTNGMTRACGIDTGACSFGSQTCTTGAWGTCTGGVGPAIETCNGADDDCDGMTDEMLTQACGTDTGACQAGTQTCSSGSWGSCAGSIGPITERCDGVVDDDCDGVVDDGCNCVTGATRQCGATDVGACTFGTETCSSSGQWGSCVGYVGPVAETCNNVDDDCDGTRDDGVTRSCGTDTGACVAGTETCSLGSWGSCTGSVGPVAERCDGAVDDDCDGVVDDGCNCVTGRTRTCGATDRGACTFGTETCSSTGQWGSCIGYVGPVAETCNNADDDCDGAIDDGVTRQCGIDTGSCSYGTQACASGGWGTCTGGVGPATELCDSTRNDEDCDGLQNEGCACTNGQTQQCGTTTGRCEYGSQTCNLSGVWSTCSGGIGPIAETCNGIDDDCDGTTDEGVCTGPVVMCPSGLTAEVLSTVTLSASGSDPDGGTPTFTWSVVTRPVGSNRNPSSPTSPTTTFYLDAAGTYVLRFCARDNEGETACCETTVVSTPPGVLHVELQWDQPYGDVDLHMLNVNQTSGWFSSPNDCFFGNRTPDWGTGGAVANPTLDIDDRDGYGPENITIDNSPQTGTYYIGVHNFCSRSASGSGAVTGTVRVYCMGAMVASYPFSMSTTDEFLTIASIAWPTCTARALNTRSNGSSLVPASTSQTFHCEVPCDPSRNDCPRGDYCALVSGPPRYICILDRR
jgi:hypothetical protein